MVIKPPVETVAWRLHPRPLRSLGGMRLESPHPFALPTYDLVRRKIQGQRVQATAYRKTLLTLPTLSGLMTISWARAAY